MNWKTAANVSGYSPTKSRNRPRRRGYRLSYASADQPAIICLKFEGHRRPVYDVIDRTAREANISRQQVIFNALATYFKPVRVSRELEEFQKLLGAEKKAQ